MNRELQKTYDRIAEDWHRDHEPDDWWMAETEAFAARLRPDDTILDVGCGSGVKSKYFTDRGLVVSGIDISQGLLDIAKRVAPLGSYRLLGMEDLDQISDSFTAVFSQASLLHIRKAEASTVVRKMADRLVPGGFLYIAVKEVKEGKPEEEIRTENDYGYEYQRFFSYYTQEEIEGFMRDSGLAIVSSVKGSSGKTVWVQVVGQKSPGAS